VLFKQSLCTDNICTAYTPDTVQTLCYTGIVEKYARIYLAQECKMAISDAGRGAELCI